MSDRLDLVIVAALLLLLGGVMVGMYATNESNNAAIVRCVEAGGSPSECAQAVQP